MTYCSNIGAVVNESKTLEEFIEKWRAVALGTNLKGLGIGSDDFLKWEATTIWNKRRGNKNGGI